MKTLFVYLVLGFVVMSYQNCAAPQNDFSEDSPLAQSPTASPDVDGIDRVEVGQIFFPEKAMHVSRKSEILDVLGVCEQTGAIISWTLRNSDDRLVERGQSDCDQGVFRVELEGHWKTACGDLQLKAALGAKATSEVTLISDCAIL